jgi:hypothetical protein
MIILSTSLAEQLRLPFDFSAQTIQNNTEQARSSPIDKNAHPPGEDRTRFEDVELGDTSYQSRSYRDSLDGRRKSSDEVANFEIEQQQVSRELLTCSTLF